jgi:hypothetical protein
MKQYTFDVKLFANVEIVAETEEDARVALRAVIGLLDIDDNAIDGINDTLSGKTLPVVRKAEGTIPAIVLHGATVDTDDDEYEDGADVDEEDFVCDCEGTEHAPECALSGYPIKDDDNG